MKKNLVFKLSRISVATRFQYYWKDTDDNIYEEGNWHCILSEKKLLLFWESNCVVQLIACLRRDGSNGP